MTLVLQTEKKYSKNIAILFISIVENYEDAENAENFVIRQILVFWVTVDSNLVYYFYSMSVIDEL